MFQLVTGLPWLIVLVRFILPLDWPWTLKALLAVVLLIASQYHYFSRLSSGSVFSPEFPRPLVIAFNVLFGAIVLLAVFQLALDVAALLVLAVTWQFPVIAPEVRYAAGIAALALSSFGVNRAIIVPPLKDMEIAIPGLAAAFDGYRIVQLTDLHISRLFPAAWTASMVAKTNALEADLIVITGDFIDGSLENRRADVEPLRGLSAHDGVYAISGNHEYFFDADAFLRHFEGMDMRLLSNSHAVIERGAAKLVIAGVPDHSAGRNGYAAPDLGAALSGVPEQAPVILLDHQPMQAKRAADSGVALQLSGHTHGGMIRGMDRLLARANNGFVSGLYQVGSMQLYVNNGTALWPGFALRLGRPAELTRITLRQKS
ncbi:metallophosphoesterase [Hoeflea sp. AS60]|uniref:metallophosphoesterase n=1 Tax=Hoeflea sp. AS60 TaxID=3135780 RepID=UPI00316F6C13